MAGLPLREYRFKISYKQRSDKDLMRLFTDKGDIDAYTELYVRYYKSIYKFFVWNTGNKEIAADLNQSVFEKLFTAPHLFDSKKNFRVWLYSIAKNRWKNEVRSLSIDAKHRKIMANNIELSTQEAEIEEPDSTRLAMIQKSMSLLSELHREIIVLKYSNNLTIDEISQVLQCSQGTVKSRLFNAIKKLKNIIHE